MTDMSAWTSEETGSGANVLVAPDGIRVYSPTRNRFYTREFNHTTAREWHALGYTHGEIARTLGVSSTAISIAVDLEEARRYYRQARNGQRGGICEGCGAATLKSTAAARRVHDGRSLCRTCRSIERRTGVNYLPGGDFEVQCARCRAFLPPDMFGTGTRYRDLRDGGFRPHCRPCETAARQDYRARHTVPCEGGCGNMVEGKGRGTKPDADPDRPFLCHRCWHKARRGS